MPDGGEVADAGDGNGAGTGTSTPERTPSGGVMPIQRPPPGVAPPKAPPPPWVRTVAGAEAAAGSGADESSIVTEDYEDDFEEETGGESTPSSSRPPETSQTQRMSTNEEAKKGGEEQGGGSASVAMRSSAMEVPLPEASSSPKGLGPSARRASADSLTASAFAQGLSKLSDIKASVDVYATDSDDEEASKQRFFSKLEDRWRESHESEPLDYSVLNRLLDSVDSTVGDNPTAQLVEAAKRATEGSPGRVASASPQQEPKDRPGEPSDNVEGQGTVKETPGDKAALSRPPSGRSVVMSSLGSPSAKALKRSASAVGRLAESKESPSTLAPKAAEYNAEATKGDKVEGAEIEVTEQVKESETGAKETEAAPSDGFSDASKEQRKGRGGKLHALKQNQQRRRRPSASTASLSGSISERSTVDDSAPASPKQRVSQADDALLERFAELEKQMAAMGPTTDAREAQARVHNRERQELEVQTDKARRAVTSAEAKAAETVASAEAREKALREGYEGRLREKQRELSAAKLRLQELESAAPKGRVLAEGETVVTLSDKELASLRQEIKEQDQLIAAYQQENEAAVAQIKELKEASKQREGRLVDDISRLEGQLMDLKEKGAVAAQTVGSKLKEKLSLEVEINAVKEAAAEKEEELRGEIERLRREKRELDSKLGGVDLRKMEHEDNLVKTVRSEMEALKEQQAAGVKEMEAKLAWYAENQEILTANDELIQQQADTIAVLEKRLRSYEGEDGKGTATVRKVKQLQKQLEQLQEALTARNPTSVAALVHAARPSLQETEQVREMQATIDTLKHRVRAKDEEMERKLRGLRQEHEKVRQQFEVKKCAAEERETRADMRRIKEMEKQLADVRAFYQKKVKALTEELAATKKAVDVATAAPSGRRGFVGRRAAAAERQHRRVLEEGAESDDEEVGGGSGGDPAEIAGLKAEVARITALQQRSSHRLDAVTSERQANEEGAVVALRRQVNELLAEREQLRQSLEEVAKLRGDVEEARRRAESAEMAAHTIQRAHTEAVEKATRAESAQERALRHLHEEHAARVHEVRMQAAQEEGRRWETRCRSAEKAVEGAEAKIAALEAELGAAESGLPYAPSAAQFRALERKIEQLEENERVKEQRWQSVLEETQEVHGMQAAMQQRKWEMALQEKNMEIERFRRELDAILGVAQELSQKQSGTSWMQASCQPNHEAQYTKQGGMSRGDGCGGGGGGGADPLHARDLNVSPGPPVGVASSLEARKQRGRTQAWS